MKVIVFVLLALLLVSSEATAEEPEIRFDRQADFAMLHHELVANDAFHSWRQSECFGAWRETPRTSEGTQVVLVQANGCDNSEGYFDQEDVANQSIFAAEIQHAGSTVSVRRSRTFS